MLYPFYEMWIFQSKWKKLSVEKDCELHFYLISMFAWENSIPSQNDYKCMCHVNKTTFFILDFIKYNMQLTFMDNEHKHTLYASSPILCAQIILLGNSYLLLSHSSICKKKLEWNFFFEIRKSCRKCINIFQNENLWLNVKSIVLLHNKNKRRDKQKKLIIELK